MGLSFCFIFYIFYFLNYHLYECFKTTAVKFAITHGSVIFHFYSLEMKDMTIESLQTQVLFSGKVDLQSCGN